MIETTLALLTVSTLILAYVVFRDDNAVRQIDRDQQTLYRNQQLIAEYLKSLTEQMGLIHD